MTRPAPIDAPIAPIAPADDADPSALLDRAARRARAAGRPYGGDALPVEAWTLHRAGAARLVDVRNEAEWIHVGRVDGVPLVQWRLFGAEQTNPRFIEQLAAVSPRDEPVLLLCRSGVRSQAAAAAATAAGWAMAINVLEGFEGDLDEARQRGRIGGWRRSGLEWVQS